MGNDWFQFKQFKIVQKVNAMKVSTDACIFGAWLSHLFQNKSLEVLDIGTGTGLLSLMWLQKNPQSRVTAIEPVDSFAEEAALNFQNSPWGRQLKIIPKSLESFSHKSNATFELIICNPPFFENQLKGCNAQRNRARHDSLQVRVLAEKTRQLVIEGGKLAVIYPTKEWSKWQAVAKTSGWQLEHFLEIKPNSIKPVNRVCGLFSATKRKPFIQQDELLIYDRQRTYTTTFIKLLQPYYLFL